jgi:hypothetical protein
MAQLWFDTSEKGAKAMKTKIHSKTLAVAAAVMLGIASTGGSAVARGAHGGGGFGMPLISAPSNPVPQFNPSSPYTVTPSAETPVSPASPGSVFH